MEDRFAHMNKRVASEKPSEVQKTRMPKDRFEVLYSVKLVTDAVGLANAAKAFADMKNKKVTRIILEGDTVEIWFRSLN